MDNDTTKYIITQQEAGEDQIYMIIPPTYPIQGEVVTSFDTIDEALEFLANEIEHSITEEHKNVEFRF